MGVIWWGIGGILYAVSGVLALAWHRDRHEAWPGGGVLAHVDRWASTRTIGHVWIGSGLLLAVLTSVVLTLGTQSYFRDPKTWYQATSALLAGGNPYAPVPPFGTVVAYATPFILVEAPFVALLGLKGTFLASGFLAALLPPVMFLAGRAYRGSRVGAYAGLLSLTVPYLLFYTTRWAGEDIWVALSVILALWLMLEDRAVLGFAVAGALAVKFVTFLPLIGWALVAWRKRGMGTSLRWGLGALAPYVLILVGSVVLWGTGYVETLYLEHTVERSAAGSRPTVNLFHLAALAGWTPPAWMFLLQVGLLGLAYALVWHAPVADPVRSGTFLFALALLVINTVSTDFLVWLAPLALLLTLGTPDQGLLRGPLVVVALSLVFHAFDLLRFTAPGDLRPWATGLVTIVATVLLACVAYQALEPGRDGIPDPQRAPVADASHAAPSAGGIGQP